MASAQSTIDLIFNGIDKTGAATMAALDNAKKFSGSLQNITAPIADFTSSAVKLEAGLLASGLAMTVFATKTAGDFEQAFAQIRTLFDASDTDIAAFKESVKLYAAESGKSMEDVMASLGAAIGSGVKYTDSLALMTVAEKLAIATKSDMKGATEVLVGTLNAYGLATKDAGALADLMFQIIKDGKIEMTDLSASLASVTPIAAAAGIGMKEVGAAIAVLTAAGMQPSSAIDALKSAITNIIKPSEQATKLAASLGIEFNATALKAKGLEGVFQDVAKATGGSADKMALLFGDVTGLAAVMTLTGPQATKFSETILSMAGSAGSVSKAYELMAGTIDIVTQKISNAFTGLMLTIGTPMLDEFGGIANAIANIFKALGDSAKTGGLKTLVDYIESVFKDLQTTIETVAKNLPAALAKTDFSGFKGGIDAVINALKSLFGNIDLTSVDGLTKAIELAGVAFLGLSKFTAGVIESFKPLFDWLVKTGSEAGKFDTDLAGLAGTIGGVASQLNLVLPLFDGLLAILAAKQGLGLIKDIATMTGTMAGASTAAGALAVALGKAGLVGAAGAAGYAVGGLVKDGIDVLLSRITGGETTLGGFIYDLTHTGDQAAIAAAGTTKAADGVAKLGNAAGGIVGNFDAANAAMLENFAASEKAATGTGKLASAHKDVGKYALETVPIFDALTGQITGYEQQLVKSAKGTIDLSAASRTAAPSLASITKETEKAQEATKKWNEELAKMAFEEKLKLIDSQTKITVASIEADSKKAVAAFESISAAITSTGDVLGKLFTNLDFSKIGWAEQKLIEDQIAKENAWREESFKIQKALMESQIRQMDAQTAALIKGDGLIQISGDGLKPHLEAFMWEILSAIQVRVNSDGLKLLLGI